MDNAAMRKSLMQAMSDNKAWVKMTGPAHNVTVKVTTEADGYKSLVVTVDGRERMRVSHIHPQLLHVEG